MDRRSYIKVGFQFWNPNEGPVNIWKHVVTIRHSAGRQAASANLSNLQYDLYRNDHFSSSSLDLSSYFLIGGGKIDSWRPTLM